MPRCPECGTERAEVCPPDGLCARCLLKQVIEGRRAAEELSLSEQETLATLAPEHRDSTETTAAELAPGESLGSYEIVRLLGKGGMGVVYEANDRTTGRRVALKVLAEAADSSGDRERFLREGRLAAQVSHPNSVYVFGTEEIDGIQVIVMELLPGGTLEDRLRKSGPLSAVEAVEAALQIIAGLEGAEAKGVLHRDIKPANCFVDSDGTVKIGDFGLSISTLPQAEPRLTAKGTLMGTPAFSSPEQLKGEELDVRSDIYSLGASLYWLLTGQTPFSGGNVVEQIASIMGEAPPSPVKLRPELPAGLAKVILRCLEKNPDARYSDYAGLTKALSPFGATLLHAAPPGRRFVAGFLDFLVAFTLFLPFQAGSFVSSPPFTKPEEDAARIVVALVYFTLLEGFGGMSLGKALIGLRVVTVDGRPAGLVRAAVRAVVFLLFLQVPWAVVGAASGLDAEPAFFNSVAGEPVFWLFSIYTEHPYHLVALLLAVGLFATARRANGLAGLHDLASATRVVRDQAEIGRVENDLVEERVELPLPHQQLGPYELISELEVTDDEHLFVGYDRLLDRKAWIHVIPYGTPAVPPQRRDASRVSRLRWLNGEREAERCWDAYEWEEGATLDSILHKRHPWAAVRYWLFDLAKELEATEQEEGFPVRLDSARIWITASGTAKLLDFTPSTGANQVSDKAEEVDFEAAQKHLYRHAFSALNGPPGPIYGEALGPRVPLPLHAQRLMGELEHSGFSSPSTLRERLQAILSRRPSVPRRLRLAHFACWSFVPVIVATLFLADAIIDSTRGEGPPVAFMAIMIPTAIGAFWGILAIPSMVTATIFRGGMLFRLTGIALVGESGRVVGRGRAFVRSVIAWSAVLAAFSVTWFASPTFSSQRLVSQDAAAVVAIAFLVALPLVHIAGSIWAIVTPERGAQDRIARTYLVPR